MELHRRLNEIHLLGGSEPVEILLCVLHEGFGPLHHGEPRGTIENIAKRARQSALSTIVETIDSLRFHGRAQLCPPMNRRFVFTNENEVAAILCDGEVHVLQTTAQIQGTNAQARGPNDACT